MSDFISKMQELERKRKKYDQVKASADSIDAGMKMADEFIKETVEKVKTEILRKAESKNISYELVENRNIFGKVTQKKMAPRYETRLMIYYRNDPHIYGCVKGIGSFYDYDGRNLDGYVFCHKSVAEYFWNNVIDELAKERIYPVPKNRALDGVNPIYRMNNTLMQKRGILEGKNEFREIEKRAGESKDKSISIRLVFPL